MTGCKGIVTGMLGMGLVFAGGDIPPRHIDPQYDAMTSASRLTTPEDTDYVGRPVQILNKSTIEAYQFDPAAGAPAIISYSVSRNGWVRVRLVRREGAGIVLRTLQNWTLSQYGKTHRVEWDGRDASGNPVDRRNMFVAFDARDSAHDKIHRKHSWEACRDPGIIISRPGDGATSSATDRIVVSFEEQAPHTDSGREMEVRLYIDFELAKKLSIPSGTRQFTLDFDTAKPGAWQHLLTVNVDDLQDHIGAASLLLPDQT